MLRVLYHSKVSLTSVLEPGPGRLGLDSEFGLSMFWLHFTDLFQTSFAIQTSTFLLCRPVFIL